MKSESGGKVMHKYLLLTLVIMVPAFGQNTPADLRAAAGCGPMKTEFSVKSDKKQHVLVQPESGKAIVYVFSEYVTDPQTTNLGHVTTRVGMDGNWMGANHESTYMSFGVDPGSHRLCADAPVRLAPRDLSVAADLNAEPGKTYYYRATLKNLKLEPPQLALAPIDQAEGVLLIAKFALSTSQVKK
jgi:hypothetical protein